MNEEWTTVIKPKTGWLDINLKELWRYRDLLFMFIKRNYKGAYKQTILGPLWFLITPLLTSSVFTVVFGKIAQISTDGVPQFLYYMAGNTAWAYFSTCLTSTSSTFTGNAGLFGKVYFPRLIAPMSTVIYAMLSFFLQLLLMIALMIYFAFLMPGSIHPNGYVFLLPVMVMQMALLGMGTGIIISALTTKYRDLSILVGFGVQLWMYATPIVYPLSAVPERLRGIMSVNPMMPIINNFKYAFLGCGHPELASWGISWIITLAVLFIGIIIFSRVEKTFLDTV